MPSNDSNEDDEDLIIELEEPDDLTRKIETFCEEVNKCQRYSFKRRITTPPIIVFQEEEDDNEVKRTLFEYLDKIINLPEDETPEKHVEDINNVSSKEEFFNLMTNSLQNDLATESDDAGNANSSITSPTLNKRRRLITRHVSDNSFFQSAQKHSLEPLDNYNNENSVDVSFNFLNSQPSTSKADNYSQTELEDFSSNLVEESRYYGLQTMNEENNDANVMEEFLEGSTSNIGRNMLIKYMEDTFDIGRYKTTGTQQEDESILSQYFHARLDTNRTELELTSPEVTNDSNDNVKSLLKDIDNDITSILRESIENAKLLESLKQRDYHSLSKGDKSQLIANKIYDIFSKLLADSEDNKELVLRLRKFTSHKDCVYDAERGILKPKSDAVKMLKYKKPCFSLIIYLLRKIISLIKSDGYCTRREIYYQSVKFIKNQVCIDNAVADICSTLDVAPWDIRIVASSKGLVYGNLKLILKTGEIVNCNVHGGTLIPLNVNEIDKFETDATFILVIEKDSMFQKLLDEKVMDKLNKPFILITGKGNPDVNTRHFLKQLSTKVALPVYILVDADAYGINIFFTYKFGSVRLCHLSEQLAVPNIKWLGIHPSEISRLNISVQELKTRDKVIIKNLLKAPFIEHYPKIENELRILLERNVKSEMEGLIKTNTFFTDFYLHNKFLCSDFL